MDLKEIDGIMRTTKDGSLMISTKEAFDQFFRDNPNSSFTYKIVKNSNKSRKKLFAYYYAEVIPKIMKGYYNFGDAITESEAISNMLRVSTIEKDNINDFNYFELQRHIQECIIFASQNLDIVIDEPI